MKNIQRENLINGKYIFCFFFRTYERFNTSIYKLDDLNNLKLFINNIIKSKEDIIQLQIEDQNNFVNIYTDVVKAKNLNYERIFESISNNSSSNQIISSDNIKINILIIFYKTGHARGNYFNDIYLPRYFIKKDDSSCFFDSMAYYLLKYIENNVKPGGIYKEKIYKKGRELSNLAKVKYSSNIGKNEIEVIENRLEMSIVIFEFEKGTIFRTIVFFPVKSSKLLLYRQKSKWHYSTTNFCNTCFKFIPKFNIHKCDKVCLLCRSSKCTETDLNERSCIDCHRIFRNENCFNLHIISKVCEEVKICLRCNKEILKKSKHDCNITCCSVCRVSYKNKFDHICKIQPKKLKSKSNQNKLVLTCYYDIETILDNQNNFIPSILVSHIICNSCTNTCDNNINFKCTNHSKMKEIFESEFKEDSETCIVKFINYLINVSETHKDCSIYAVAHNGSRFDSAFIYDALLEYFSPNIFKSDPIKKGNALLQIQIWPDIFFKDSIQFIPSSLKKNTEHVWS